MDVINLLQECLSTVMQGKLPETDMIKLLISKGLSYGIILGSTLVKLPQILNVVRAESAEGLSAMSFELETVGLTIHAGYGYIKGLPFSAYGEAIMLFVQNLLLLALIYRYARTPAIRVAAVTSILAAGIGILASGQVTPLMITRAYEANNLTLLAARLPQIWKALSERSTGQLSIITYGMNLAGSLARIFTALQEGGGMAMVRAYGLSAALNAIIVAQILVLGNKGVAKKARTPAARAKKKA